MVALRRLTRAVSAVTSLLIAGCAIVVFAGVVAARADQLRLATVLTGSMTPGIPVGSVVLGTPLAAADVRVGDVIMFRPPEPFANPGNAPVVHRVTDVTVSDGTREVRTRGDANQMSDPWVLDAGATTMYQVRADSRALGFLSRFGAAASWPVLLAVAVLLLAVRALRTIWRPADRRPPSRRSGAMTRRQQHGSTQGR